MNLLFLIIPITIMEKLHSFKNRFNIFKIRIKNKWDWLGIIGTPFKFPKPTFYLGRKEIGNPYFVTQNKLDLQVMGLQWKVKFGKYRHQWSPRIILTLFKWQIVVFFGDNRLEDMCRWEAWLNYKEVSSLLSNEERLAVTKVNYTAEWMNSDEVINYYNFILKNKYRKNKNY